MATMNEELLYSKYAKEVFTINITFIDTFKLVNPVRNPCAEIPLGSQGVISTLTQPTGKPILLSGQRKIRGSHTTTTKLVQRKVTLADMAHGDRIAPKFPYILQSRRSTKFFMTLALSAIWHEAKLHESFWNDENKIMKDSTIHFEVFDEQDNLVFAPLDLLHPTALNYESGNFGFIRQHKPEAIVKFEDDHGYFTLLKRPNKYGSVEEYILSSLDIYTARLRTDVAAAREMQIDRETIRSIYAGLPTNEVCNRDMFYSCKWENNLIRFVSHFSFSVY